MKFRRKLRAVEISSCLLTFDLTSTFAKKRLKIEEDLLLFIEDLVLVKFYAVVDLLYVYICPKNRRKIMCKIC